MQVFCKYKDEIEFLEKNLQNVLLRRLAAEILKEILYIKEMTPDDNMDIWKEIRSPGKDTYVVEYKLLYK